MSQTKKQQSPGSRRFILAALVAAFMGGASLAMAEGVVNVYNWAEYIGEDTIENFEKEFGIKVVYDLYDSVETVDAKLMAGSTGYDVVSHSGSAVGRLIPAGILQKLDKSKLPNWANMREDITAQLAANWDPGNQHMVPFMWGTHGITYNEQMVREVHPDAPIGSMDLIFDPASMEKLAQCGVTFLDSPTDVIPMALAHLGLNPSSTNKADYKKVEELLLAVRPYIKTFDNYAYQRLAEKEFCVSVTWGPDGLFAQDAAIEAGITDVELKFYHPPGEGKANIWVDGWVIPADAKNVENAHKFLNYMMRPEVAAADTNSTWYANANKHSLDMVEDNIKNSNAVYPSPEEVRMMYSLEVLPPKIKKVQTRTWSKVRTGR